MVPQVATLRHSALWVNLYKLLPKSPTSVIPAKSLPSRRRGRESIPDKARRHDTGSSHSLSWRAIQRNIQPK